MSESTQSVSEARLAMDKLRFAKNQELTHKAYGLKNNGVSNRNIAAKLGVSESTIRRILSTHPHSGGNK